ncbi:MULTISPECIES: carbohydrate ABC transporter permease [Paenibacillus]|uniref:ABC transporter permease n=1 Tax=Paenibacillus odorifer TaxID=189426 RepID=A0A1R0WWB9_9BACL|nr:MULTISPECIES: carbohydrate ABC transporter permease [Paenibacillus]AIQ73732.1 ABC transporter permease [Paenibacillus odorifer]AWV33080.1 carbohydrate ABC transporter permease [Paenibacillus odorifer]ETT45066.1 binding-protein-dependent transport systems inner membrane component [Paenibacillus sp. FSL H8-237]MDH6426602.1 putative aldouronate transport system permease protein [Paenibacillus sp. PastH-4]MDH6442626.1 putative aldouronate transport system permease protein [Paenibacillus sp. Pas
MNRTVAKEDLDSRIFNTLNIILLCICTIIIVVPLWNVVISSLSSGKALAEGGFIFWSPEFSLENYRAVFQDETIGLAFVVSLAKTFIGVITHVFFCAMIGYGLSKKYIRGRKLYVAMGVITMFFSGGMIPTYLLIKSLGLLNSFWVYIIPALFSYYDVVILMNFFRNVPDSLEESAKIDGAGDWRIFLKIFIPLSMPAMATIALFNGVGQWNDFMTTKLYITDQSLYPLQMKLYEIIVQSQTQSMQNVGGSAIIETTTKGVQLATIVITTLPIVVMYPILQRYFISGMMMGAVKE